MRLARVLGAIGRGLISAGVIVLLFVAYQLWGTGLQNAATQDNLADDFSEATGLDVGNDLEALAAAARQSQEAIDEGQIGVGTTVNNLDESTDTEDDAAEADDAPQGAELIEPDLEDPEYRDFVAKLYPEAGDAFARINIPAINVDQIVVEGVSVEDLRKGPGHYRTTPNPGQAGNAAIAGHRTTYGAPFHRVDELNPGDAIFVQTAQGVFEYRVIGFDDPSGEERGYFIVSPSQTEVLDQKPNENILTLTACHPKYSARQRIIVQAELVGDPAPTIPRGEASELGEEVTLDSGAVDERARAAGVIPAEEQQVISAEVAADDDPTVDADGNPIDDAGEADTLGDEATDNEAEGIDEAPAEARGGDEEPAGSDTTEAVAADSPGDSDGSQADAVTASFESEPSPLSTDDFGEGLNGDPTKVQPAIMWGSAGLFIWLAAWFIGHRLERKWTFYALGLIPFAIVLWSTFVNVDQALPSY